MSTADARPDPNPPPPPLAGSSVERLRLAVVHDWLLGMRGGEWLLATLLERFPLATIHTLFYRPDHLTRAINSRPVRPSPLSRLPGARRYYRWLLPLLPGAVERLRLESDCELVLTISHCVAHGVHAPSGVPKVNYYLSPMRYLYDQGAHYRRGTPLAGRALRWARPRLLGWDRRASKGADETWAISRFVAGRIQQAYGLDARIIYPPVRTGRFTPPEAPRRIEEFLLVSAMVPYKRVDLAIEAANRLRLPLRVVGQGPLAGAMRGLAGPTVTVEGPVGEERLLELYRTRLALIFPGQEDFGIVPLEAMACGMPVLGLRAGGLLETLPEGRCGAFFDSPNLDSLSEAWRTFDPGAYDTAALRRQAEQFSERRFLDNVVETIEKLLGI